MDQRFIRNFCIIAHIDHGKSTLADRLLEATGTVAWGEGRGSRVEQVLDQMDLEREKGVTIKAKAVRMAYTRPARPPPGTGNQEPRTGPPPAPGAAGEAPVHRGEGRGESYELNLIDTPGHVDFAYEVSRALSACEGAVLVVDAAQGVQAQTLANVYAAWEHDLKLVPVVNKIDLPNAEPERVAQELVDVLGFQQEEIVFTSAKEGVGTDEVLEAIVERVPPPAGRRDAPLRALIFDSKYDAYKGVIAYVRVVDGSLSLSPTAGRQGGPLRLMAAGRTVEPLEVGVLRPHLVPAGALSTGEVGYIATGLKNVTDCRVGDTFTGDASPASEPLPGYRPAKPMVFAGLYPAQPNDYGLLRDALDKLRLSDSSLVYEAESSAALGFGFRCGFLGLLHMEIVQERLEREYDLSLLTTAPSVEYQVRRTDGSEMVIDNPADLPPPNEVAEVREPWMDVTIISPDRYVGPIMELVTGRRGQYRRMEYLQPGGGDQPGTAEGGLVSLEYQVPLSETLVDFYDQLKSRSQGYASMDYALSHYAPAKLVKLDILVNFQPVDALSVITTSEEATARGRALVEKLRSVIPRQLFDVALQASIGSRVVARETIRALRKNVLAKCYGGDVTRKRKLLEKQAEGKKRMKRLGNVEIPQEAFMAVLKLER